jgi:hypothetical protein
MLADVARASPMTPEHFAFYVAGGFVVGDVLGFPPWGDIDVFVRPHWSPEKRSWLVPVGSALYPVQLLVVNDPESIIGNFDLHICQCAIKCTFVHGRREYQLLVTSACANAWMSRRSMGNVIHAAVAQQRRLATRLEKYAHRGLPPFTNMLEKTPGSASMYQLRSSCQQPNTTPWSDVSAEHTEGAMDVYWVVTVRDGFLAAVDLCALRPDSRAVSACPAGVVCSDVAVLYPCVYDQSYSQMAYARGDRHWLVRSLAGTAHLVCFPGGVRIWSQLLKPTWLLDRKGQSLENLLSDVRAILPRYALGPSDLGDDFEQYAIKCNIPVQLTVMFKDWALDAVRGYGPQWSLYMHTGGRRHLPGHMFCSNTLHLCTECEHGTEADVPLC